jgi:hypothetical protein
LSRNFNELIAAGDLDALRNVYDGCRIDAHDRNTKRAALTLMNVPTT